MKRLCVVALGMSLALGSTRRAGADEQSDAKARAIYDQAQTQYSIGQFPKAIELYKQAYELSKRPSLLFNIGQAYRLSGDPKQAKFFYESYLRAVPDAGNRAEVEGRIKDMDAEIAKPKAPPVVAPPPTHREMKPALFYGGIATAGAGVVAVGLGVFFGLRAKGFADDVDNAGNAWSDELEQAEKDGKSANKLMYVMYGVGGALLIGGGVLLFMGRPRDVPEKRVSFTPILSTDGFGVAVGGRF